MIIIIIVIIIFNTKGMALTDQFMYQ